LSPTHQRSKNTFIFSNYALHITSFEGQKIPSINPSLLQACSALIGQMA